MATFSLAARLSLSPSLLLKHTTTKPAAIFRPLLRPISTTTPRRSVTAAASPEAGKDTSVDVQVSKDAPQRTPPPTSLDRRAPRRAALDISPFGLVDPWSPMRSVRQMFDTMDRFLEDSAIAIPGGTTRVPWEVREGDDDVKIRLDVPGLSKEELKVVVEDDVLVIKADQVEGEEDDRWWRREEVYDVRLVIPDICDKDSIKAELKNGVLLVTFPKNKAERKVIDVEVQ